MKIVRTYRKAISFALILLLQVATADSALALTSGPAQPEFTSMSEISVSDLVDPATGDVKYSIPLGEVGQVPLVLNYSGNIGVEDEASWVGLGWTLNPGSIHRNVRGLPDDFKGDMLHQEMNVKPDVTVGVNFGASMELFGYAGIKATTGLYYNTYTGWGLDKSYSPSVNLGEKNGPPTLSTSLDYNTQAGFNAGIGLSFATKEKGNQVESIQIGGYNSRAGLKSLSIGVSLPKNSDFGGSVDFFYPTYFPMAEFPMKSEAQTGHFQIGGAVFGTHGSLMVDGYKNSQELKTKLISNEAYGYLYSRESGEDDRYVSDYNIEKDMPVSPEMPVVPPVIGTPDLFMVNAPGENGELRIYRNDIGNFSPARRKDNGFTMSVSGELGAGNAFHGGADVIGGGTKSAHGPWRSGNQAKSKLAFTENNAISHTSSAELSYEPAFMAFNDENWPSDSGFYQQSGKYDPARVRLHQTGREQVAIRVYNTIKPDGKEANYALAQTVKSAGRQARTRYVSYLTHAQAAIGGLDKTIKTYKENVFSTGCGVNPASIEYNMNRRSFPQHHISEITTVGTDGTRRVFGFPVYNGIQREVSFSINTAATDKNLAEYATGDNSINNTKGRENYYKSQELGMHAYEYLMTAILSNDYVDRSGDGISWDDAGTATRINYNYNPAKKWRTPLSLDPSKKMGQWYKGNLAFADDDKVSYVYGIKNACYPHSIESATQIAHFYVSARKDGLGVVDQNGAINALDAPRKLDSIRIYSRLDLEANGVQAIPVKTIVFEYTTAQDALCQGIPNSSEVTYKGKLTLAKVYTKYFNSQVRYNKYSFDYYRTYVEGTTKSFSYGLLKQDMWGQYRSNDYTHSAYLYDYPFSLQDGVSLDKYANAFKLKDINLPSGGKISLEYESDDYAYVQDKRAGQMMPILGFSQTAISASNSNLYESPGTVNSFIRMTLPASCPANQVRERYFQNVDQLYCDFLITLKSGVTERVKGYADIDVNNITPNASGTSTATEVRIPVVPVAGYKGVNVHPITFIANQMLRTSHQRLVIPGYDGVTGGLKALVKGMVDMVEEINTTINGFDRVMAKKGYAKSVDVSKSWIRLASPTYKKEGGGHRVKKVRINDNWSAAGSGNVNSEYGQEYFYTTSLRLAEGTLIEISSGVASWEPPTGGAENLHRIQERYKEKAIMAPSNYHYVEKPVGESLFPSPQIVYSKVKVRNITARDDLSSNGYKLYEYYTARDFPTIARMTNKQATQYKSDPIVSFFKIDRTTKQAVSQGISVEVNDMHGKLKQESVYSESGNLISYTQYKYKTAGNKLDNRVTVINPNGSKKDQEMGIKMDVWQDFQENQSESWGIGLAVNSDAFYAFVPIVMPTFWPKYNRSEQEFKRATTTKFINRTAIIDRIIHYENGSRSEVRNIAFDAVTGEVLITSRSNENKDLVYNTSFPAHWTYDGMSMAYINGGIEFKTSIASGVPGSIQAALLREGDEVLLGTYNNPDNPTDYFTGLFTVTLSAGQKILINRDKALPPNGTYYGKIIRSGRRNMQSMPLYEFTGLTHPINPSGSAGIQRTDSLNILEAKAFEYDSVWAINPVSPNRISCTDSITTYNDVFLKDTLLATLIQFDYLWYTTPEDARTVFDVVKVKFPSIFPSTWGGERINAMPFSALSEPVGLGTTMFRRYEAQVGSNCKIVLLPCSGILPVKQEANAQRMIPGAPCELFDLNALTLKPAAPTAECGILLEDPATGCQVGAKKICSNCGVQSAQCELFAIGDANNKIHPVTSGLTGNWRLRKSHVFHGNRKSTGASNLALKTRADGAMNTFAHFWKFETGASRISRGAGLAWVLTDSITKYDKRGQAIESYNALNIPSAAYFKYRNTVVSAAVSNAPLRNIGFDNMEDWGLDADCGTNCYLDDHFDFYSATSSSLRVAGEGHTGKYAIRLNTTTPTYSESRNFTDPSPGAAYTNSSGGYVLNAAGALPKFTPEAGTYIVSGWVKKVNAGSGKIRVSTANASNCLSGTYTRLLSPSGPIIEGWQRIYDTIVINSHASRCITLQLEFTGGGSDAVYFDDIRIHPKAAQMKTFVYDFINSKLSAVLDENNYAEFYEYDDAGNLVRIKKETERGIKTLKESQLYMSTQQSQ